MIISKTTRELSPYVAGEQPHDKKYIKLNTNENPYPPSERVKQAISQASNTELRLYPDPQCTELRKVLAKKEGVAPQNIFCGNGSDEVLFTACAAFFRGFSPALADITYSFYPVFCKLLGIAPATVKLKPDYSIDFAAFTAVAQNNGAILVNPNAPTTKSESVSDILALVKSTKNAVLVDEAYIDFASVPSLAPQVLNYDNLIVVKTFSKSYSLAGIRCGYAVASPQAITALECIRDSFNSYTVNTVTQAAATAAVLDDDYHQKTIAAVKQGRADVIARLSAVSRDVRVVTPDSDTNFYLLSCRNYTAEQIYAALRERGCLVRVLNAVAPAVRVTVGTAKQNAVVVSAVADMLNHD